MDQFNNFSITSMLVMDGVSYDAYSYTAPDALPGIALEGGWSTYMDIGPDVLYTTPVNTQHLTPLVWTNPIVASAYHNNDPTVIAPTNSDGVDRSSWTYMYFTQLPNSATTPDQVTTENQIGWAVSTNGGKSWTNLGELQVGWSPSVVQMGNHIDLFYHTGGSNPVVQLAQVSENGWQQVVAPQTLINTTTGSPVAAVNVSVALDGDKLVMVGNGIGPHENFGDIVAFIANASDPTHWEPLLSTGPTLIHGGDVELLTPEIKMTSQNTAVITFSEDVGHNSQGIINGQIPSTYTMEWMLHFS